MSSPLVCGSTDPGSTVAAAALELEVGDAEDEDWAMADPAIKAPSAIDLKSMFAVLVDLMEMSPRGRLDAG